MTTDEQWAERELEVLEELLCIDRVSIAERLVSMEEAQADATTNLLAAADTIRDLQEQAEAALKSRDFWKAEAKALQGDVAALKEALATGGCMSERVVITLEVKLGI